MNPFNIIKLHQTASTQTYIISADKEKPFDDFSVIYTTNQTAGRGQGTHIWESEKNKNISFSLILTPDFLAPSDQFRITQIISLAIVDTLVQYGLKDVKIKWPNDIYVQDKKICGMLIQNNIMGNHISRTYIGIGINVNQEKFTFAPNPTSLLLETKKEFDLDKVLDEVLENIYVRYGQLKENKTEKIYKQYISLLLYKDQYRNYIYGGRKIIAKILDVNRFGHLVLQLKDNSVIECELKQLQFVI